MSRYIDIDIAEDYLLEGYSLEEVYKMKPADVEEVRHGEWEMIPPPKVYEDGAYVRFRCSECGTEYGSSGRYCPNCGARMDGKGKTDGET